MLLTLKEFMPFKDQDGNQIKTNFTNGVIFGPKAHTFREGNRWQPGQKIHFYQNNPRTQKHDAKNGKTTYAFNPFIDRVDWWQDQETGVSLHKSQLMKGGFHACPDLARYLPLVAAVEKAMIRESCGELEVLILAHGTGENEFYFPLDTKDLFRFCRNDGFTSYDKAVEFFARESKTRKIPTFHGQIIHWSEKTVYNQKTAQIFRP